MKCLILTTSMGHESIAESIKQILIKNGMGVKLIKEGFGEVTFQYQPIYQFFPSLHKKYYKFSQNKIILKVMENLYSKKKRNKVENIVKKYKPDVVISTYFLYNFVLEKLKRKYEFNFINIVANPRTLHPLEFSPEAINLVYDKESIDKGASFGIPTKNIKEVGWFVKKDFFTRENQTNCEGNKKTILISAGSLGTTTIVKFLPTLFRYNNDFNYILVSGKNKVLYKIFNNYKNFRNLTKKDAEDVRVIGFTTKMGKLMEEADIVAGKAGPNLLFEAVTCQKPFLALTYIPGQEDGNLDIIKNKNLGWVALTIEKADEILQEIKTNRTELEEKKEGIKKESERIKKSGEKLTKIIRELPHLGKP